VTKNSSKDICRYDFLVIGSGIAGLLFALKTAEKGRVAVITKSEIAEANSNYAQGGIAAVWADDDSFELHIADTLKAGAGLCREDAVKVLVENGPTAIKNLIALGTSFTTETVGGSIHLNQEGGHSRRRVLHSKDMTGREIERSLINAVRQNSNIDVFENHTAIDLILKSKIEGTAKGDERVAGVFVLSPNSGGIKTFIAPATYLAAGGAGKVYLYTSNPDIASGDGIAMAYRAGAKIANMEFMQFHPTCFYHPKAKSFLISEAVRGEGGILKLANGETFMEKYHELKCLAPRDVVARAIDREMKVRGDDSVFLDVTFLGDEVAEKFPNIHATLLGFGVDMRKEMIPVVPAAHYICGGVNVGLYGRTSIAGLYAGGENSCTGVHGANRLASNSLLEAVVFTQRSAEKAIEEWKDSKVEINNPWSSGDAVDSDEQVVITQNWEEIRQLMWRYVGIVRSNKRLERAKKRMTLLNDEIKEYYQDFTVTSDLVELRNIATCASLIIESAMRRGESRGLHYNLDYPELSQNRPCDTFLQKDK